MQRTTRMKAPFAYYGGKSRLASWIVSLMPEHRVYIEPFAGSLSVLFAKPQVMHEVVNDVDDAVVTFFRVLRDRRSELEEACRLTPIARTEYELADLDADGLDDLEIARRFFTRVNQSFAQTAGRQTGWSVTTARTQSKAASVHSRIDRFAACAERLSAVQIENCDAADLVERLATADAVVYADPPYPDAVRVSRGERGTSTDYRADMGTDDDHRRLAKVLNETPSTVLLSGYPCDLYDELYAGWDYADRVVHAHSSNSVRSARTLRTERVWSNRPLARQMQLGEGA